VRWLVLFQVCIIEATFVYSYIYSEIDRCNIIHDRNKHSHRYINFHELEHCKESLLAVTCYYILNKLFLYTSKSFLNTNIIAFALIFPPYFTFALDKRYQIFKFDRDGRFVGTKPRLMLAYAFYVALVIMYCPFSLSMMLVVTQPLTKHLLGNTISTLVHFTAVYGVVFEEPLLISMVQFASVALLLRSLHELSNVKLYVKMYSDVIIQIQI
jgi:hypothetical protein